MKDIYKHFLFEKHILVNDEGPQEHAFEVVFSLANLFAIKIVNGKHLATKNLIKYTASCLGHSIPDPFYKGFPQTIRKLSKDELLFDQLVHYTITYGFNNFEEPRYSIMEEQFDRIAFKERAIPRNFDIITEEEAVKVLEEKVKNLLSSTRPLSESQYKLVSSAIDEYGFTVEKCPCKDTAIKYIIDTKKLSFLKFLDLSDFIKVVDFVNYYVYNNTNVKKLNLKNKDRVLLSKILDNLLKRKKLNVETCFEKQQLWCGILHHIHYKPKTEQAKNFVKTMREDKNSSSYSRFENAMKNGKIEEAVSVLLNEKGASALLRNLNYLLSRSVNDKQIDFIMDKLQSSNNIILLQLLLQYANYRLEGARSFRFSKFELLKTHTETNEEIEKRKSLLSTSVIERVVLKLREILSNNLKNKLGKVYIGEGMQNIALPLQENTSMGGFGTLTKGSILPLPEGKKIRAFTYWEKVNDIDLSLIGIDDKLHQHEFSWRTMYNRQDEYITFSGDQTSGYHGGSEYFDLDIEGFRKRYPKIKYCILCNNVYSGTGFNTCICRAGFMMRDIIDSGEVFEPKTVQSSFTINCDSNFAYLFAIDLEKRRIIWLNTAKDDSSIIAGTTSMSFLIDYFKMTEVINIKSLFTLMATEVVDNPLDADVVVSDEEVEVKEGTEVIRSYETEKLLPLIN